MEYIKRLFNEMVVSCTSGKPYPDPNNSPLIIHCFPISTISASLYVFKAKPHQESETQRLSTFP